jgi:transposase-like protein
MSPPNFTRMIRAGAQNIQRNRYTSEFKEQSTSKARQRGARTLESVANELNMSLGSLKGWLKASNYKVAEPATPASLPSDTEAQLWSPAQRLLALKSCPARCSAACLVPREGPV